MSIGKGSTLAGSFLKKTGDTLTGNLVVDPAVTIDGEDISVAIAALLALSGGELSGDLAIADGAGFVVGAAAGARLTIDAIIAELQQLGTGSPDTTQILGRFGANSNPFTTFNVRSRGATVGAQGIALDNDQVYAVEARPSDGATFLRAAVHQVEVDDAAPAVGNVGMAYVWRSMNGVDALTERMRLSAAGNLTLGSVQVARIATGSYTGDGATSLGVTGIGFTPRYVRIWDQETSNSQEMNPVETTTEMIDDNANGLVFKANESATAPEDRSEVNAIISLDADGFTVDDAGVNDHPNKSAAVYNFLAMG